MDVQLAVRRATRLHADGRLAAAVDAYRAILKRHPDTGACWFETVRRELDGTAGATATLMPARLRRAVAAGRSRIYQCSIRFPSPRS